MKRLYITGAAVFGMAMLIPMAPWLAVSDNSPLYTHFTYQFAHAHILHWLVNGWALLVLHNVLRIHRLAIAYILSVLLSFTFTVSSGSPAGTLGSSVITCFFFGLLAPYFWRKGERLTAVMMLALIIIGFFISGIAAMPHLIMFLSGIVWFFIERIYRSIFLFINDQ